MFLAIQGDADSKKSGSDPSKLIMLDASEIDDKVFCMECNFDEVAVGDMDKEKEIFWHSLLYVLHG